MNDDIEVLGLGLPADALPVGRRFRTVGRTLTEADLVGFIGVTGMVEVLFTQADRLPGQVIQGRLVPGVMVYAFAEGLLIQSVMQDVGLAFLGAEISARAPVRVGDTIHVRCEVTENRPSRRRPGTALVRTRNEVVNQQGVVALEYSPLRLLKQSR